MEDESRAIRGYRAGLPLAGAAGDADAVKIDKSSIDALDRTSGGVRELLDLRGPGVRAALLQGHAQHALGVALQQRAHRMQAVDDFSPRAQDR